MTGAAAVDPREGFPWQRSLYALLVAQFLMIAAYGFSLPFAPLYIGQLGVTDLRSQELWSGASIFAQSVMLSLLSPVWGSLADRRGRRLMMFRVAFAGGAIVALMGAAQNVYEFFGLRMMQGVVTGVTSSGTALAAAIVPRAQMGTAMGLLQIALLAGNAIGPLSGGIVGDALGFRPTFLVTGAVLSLGGLIVLFFVHERFEPPPPSTEHGLKPLLAGLRSVGSNRQLLVIMVVMFSVWFGINSAQPILPLYVKQLDTTGAAATITGAMFTITGIVSSITALFLGRLGRRFGYRRVLIVGALGAGIFYFPQAFVNGILPLAILRGLLGFFDGAIVPAANSLVGTSIAEGDQGKAFGLIYMATFLGGGMGPLAGGIIAANIGIRAVFVLTACILLGVAAALPFALRRVPAVS